MTVQWSAAVRNGILDAWETAIGTAPKLQIWSGSMPANCAAASSGSKLAEITLDADWAAAASAGSKSMQKGGLPISSANPYPTTGLAAAGAGTSAGYYRIMDSAGTTCHEQGTITVTGGGGDMTLDNISIAQSQTVNITGYTKTAPGA